MKNSMPPNFKHLGQKRCSTCYFIQKMVKTNTAYCNQHGITYPLYDAADHYGCDDHKPVIGEWDVHKTNIVEEKT